MQFALHSGGEAYEFRANLADSRADFAARPVTLPDGTRVTAVAEAAEYFRRMSRMYRRRVRLHDPTSGRLQRLLTFGNMIKHNDYRGHNLGGLGAKAALKDAFTVLFGPRVPIGADGNAAPR